MSPTTLATSVEVAVKSSGLGRTLLYRLMKEGRLPFIKVGKRRLVLVSDLQAFLEGQRVQEGEQ